jgi:hypothetical protein
MTASADPWTLPLTLGLSDGILNALILASAALLKGGHDITLILALKVGCVAFATSVFTMFIAKYAELRARLSAATRQLNLSRSGHLAATRLGRQVTIEAVQAAMIASVSSWAGATLPLIVSGTLPRAPWVGLAVAIVLLGVLGAALATSVGGRRALWVICLTLVGIAVAAIGTQLDIA